MGEARVGVSGWRYPRWRGDFYPAGLPQRRELEHLAQRTTALEVNGSFYSLLRPSTYAGIRDQTPEDFVVAVKGGRFITHLKKLRGIEAGLANFLASGLLGLGGKLGPLLWQLPPQLPYDAGRLGDFLGRLPRTHGEAAALAAGHDERLGPDRVVTEVTGVGPDRPLRHALEVRHPSYCSDDALDLLRAHDVALVLSDSPHRWPLLDERTTDFRYLRLHGHPVLYESGYAGSSLDFWVARVAAWREEGDVHVYFDNDVHGHAPHDAVTMLERLGDSPK